MTKQQQVNRTLNNLFMDSKNDHLKMLKGAAKSVLRPMQPADFEEVYLSISKQQGEALTQLIVEHDIKHMVEFGTSFGISTLYLALAALRTGGSIITTELLESKASKAKQNFIEAGVDHLIEVWVGDASKTLSEHHQPIDLLLLDGWKNLYLRVFNLLEHNFHAKTIIYVDNADMRDTKHFLDAITRKEKYQIEYIHGGKAALITVSGNYQTKLKL